MAQPINPKCLTCSQFPVTKAQHLHGHEGDRCWNPKICYRRRSHYRHRQDSNAKRRGQRAQANAGMIQSTVPTLQVPIQLPPVALIYLYQSARKDAHLHAIAVTVWQGEQKLAETKPIHCMGMTNRQVHTYLREVLKVLNEKYHITEFEPEIRMEPIECPLSPCPFKSL